MRKTVLFVAALALAAAACSTDATAPATSNTVRAQRDVTDSTTTCRSDYAMGENRTCQ